MAELPAPGKVYVIWDLRAGHSSAEITLNRVREPATAW